MYIIHYYIIYIISYIIIISIEMKLKKSLIVCQLNMIFYIFKICNFQTLVK